MKNYEFIEHTADIGIRVMGKDLKELFKNAARAMFDIIAKKKSPRRHVATSPVRNTVKLEADNPDELLINWLNELLYLSSTKDLIFSDFIIDKLDKNILQASVFGESITGYIMNAEIKAATYHDLKLKQIVSGWQVEVIFDV